MEKKKINDRFWALSLNENVSNLIFFKEDYYWGRNPFYHQQIALFMMDGLYFRYDSGSSYNGAAKSLEEISLESYKKYSDELRSEYPWNDEGKYDDGKSSYTLTSQEEGTFSADLFPEQFYNITHQGILKGLQDISDTEAEERAQEEAAEALRRKEYARNCGRVAKKLGISFENVLRLGYQDEEQLKEFQKSLLAAKKQMSAMSKKERDYYYHEIFECGRARIASALDDLGVQTFGRDVRYMDFSLLLKK